MPRQIRVYAPGPVSLPNPPYPKETLRVVVLAIAQAWRIIRDEPSDSFDIANADEDRITLELRNCLMDRVLDGGYVAGFTSDTFWVNRESKFHSYDGTHLDKMPDLHIAVRRDCSPGLRSADGIFVECKPVDRARPAGGAYCDRGIIRLVFGEYAWAMPHALMVGYADTAYKLPEKLKDAINERKKALKTTGIVTKCRGTWLENYVQAPHETTHQRGFKYPSTKTTAPEIVIRHLWLNRA